MEEYGAPLHLNVSSTLKQKHVSSSPLKQAWIEHHGAKYQRLLLGRTTCTSGPSGVLHVGGATKNVYIAEVMESRIIEQKPSSRKDMEALSIKHVSFKEKENQGRHRTQGFSDSKALVVRRGDRFKISLQFQGGPFNPHTDSLILKVKLDCIYLKIPVTFSAEGSLSRWRAYYDPEGLNPQSPSVFISTPANASVGTYALQVYVLSHRGHMQCLAGYFTLLCNPWCPEDTVFIPYEDQREEYIQNDSGLLFMGTSKNFVSKPWSFDQFEPYILETCLDLLKISPQHIKNRRKDLFRRGNPVYLSRVASAMINCEDDKGVLRGRWSGSYKDGTRPSQWTGSGDILTQWAKSGFRPVKYGQCWVFAAVMCTVMRALGIPCRIVTNFNSAHDTNGNLVIEEFYSETGKKLNHSQDSIWNFHVWVECWMKRPDLGPQFSGWQVLDPTPQERSRGVFCCGPAPVVAIRDRRLKMVYDVPFVYAEVNADVRTYIVKNGQLMIYDTDTERVGSLILTKAIGLPKPQNIIRDYKKIRSPKPMLNFRSAAPSDSPTLRRVPRSSCPVRDLSVSMDLDKAPISGEVIYFTVTIHNNTATAKIVKEHVNAQVKEYNHSPSDTIMEVCNTLLLAPMEVKVMHHQISPSQYADVVEDDLVNLAVVIEDEASQDTVLASEEFNIASPELTIQIADEDSVVPHKQHVGLLNFTNPFSVPISGALMIVGAGLMKEKAHFMIQNLPSGGSIEQPFAFIPRMVGTKMLQACLTLSNSNTAIRGYKMVCVKAA